MFWFLLTDHKDNPLLGISRYVVQRDSNRIFWQRETIYFQQIGPTAWDIPSWIKFQLQPVSSSGCATVDVWGVDSGTVKGIALNFSLVTEFIDMFVGEAVVSEQRDFVPVGFVAIRALVRGLAW